MSDLTPFLKLVVPEDAAGMRLGDFLRRRAGVSRTMLRRLRQQDGLRVDGAAQRQDYRLPAGAEVTLALAEAVSPGVAPEPMALVILYEDEDLLALDKPAGIMVHPAHGHLTGTLANGVAHYCAALGLTAPVRPVHRLDRDTSGVVLFAKNGWAHQRLTPGRGRRPLQRVYLGIAGGCLPADAGEMRIEGAIAREAGHPRRRQVHPEGAPAVTRARVLALTAAATVLNLELESGRTHQIRVHLAHLGHPLLGDRLYGGDLQLVERQALHARFLRFTHPRTGEAVALAAPLPPDLRQLLAALGLNPDQF